MDKRKKKRLYLLLTVFVVGGALLSLVYSSFTGSLVYFYTPSEVTQGAQGLEGKKIRIGGMVQEGTLSKEAGTLKIRFMVTDGDALFPVRYDGLLPDLFREGQGVVVEGIWRTGQDFVATTILAKHSEDYVPVEMTEEGVAKAKASLLKSLE